MKLSKWLPPGVALILLGTLVQDSSSTMIMGSMLLGSMAANTAMMLGKMSLGGLMMMMMSQQYGGGGGGEQANSLGGQPGLLASLGNLGRTLGNTLNTISGAASNTNKRTTRSHAVVSPLIGTATTSSGSGSGAAAGTGHVRKVVRYSRPFQPNAAQAQAAQVQSQSQGTHPNHQSSYGQANAQAHAHAYTHANSHAHNHAKAHAHPVQDQVQSWPATPTQKAPVQIQGYGQPALSHQDELFLKQLHEEIQRQQMSKQYRRRVARNVADPSPSTPAPTPAQAQAQAPAEAASNEPKPVDAASEGKPSVPAEDDEEASKKLLTYTRLMRQADSFDYMTCLPKFVCGLEAQPPTKKTSILNDYSHLLKLLFGPDDNDDDDELDDELPSDEDVNEDDPVNAYRLAFGNKERMDDKLNDELIAADPDNLKYVLKEIAKKGTKNSQYGHHAHHPSMGHYYPSMDYSEEPTQSSSILSSFLPKISAGFGSKTEDPAFDDDPFFSGFKRSLDTPVVGLDATANTGAASPPQNANNEVNVNDFEDGQGQNVKRSKRISDNSRRRKKREAIEQIVRNDPVVQKYRRAQEIGRLSKRRGTGQRDCSNAFKNCPYAWDQIMGMISNMRNMILPNATNTSPKTQQDKVVVLQVPTLGGKSKKGGTTATKTYTRNGATKLTHDIGNGNVMQITVKLAPKVTGFEPVPVVETEPYQENDELDIPSVALLPSKPKTTTTTAAPKHKRKPAFGPAGELDPEGDSSEEESSKEFSEEQEKTAQKLHSQNIGNGTRKAPKRKFKPNPGASFDFASDVDIMGLGGGTILPQKGADKVVHLKTKSDAPPPTTTATTTARPRTRGTTTTIKPSGSAAGGNKKGKRPVIMQESYKIKKRDPVKFVVEVKNDEPKPAASYKDNSDDATTSEENDDESDELDDAYDDADAAEDEFILDDRDNYRSNDRINKRRRPAGGVRPLLFDDPPPQGHQEQQQQQKEPMHVITFGGPPQGSPPPSGHSGGGGGGGVGIGGKFRRPPFPMMMRQPPILHDESKSWLPIGEQARALSDGGQQQAQAAAHPQQQQQVQQSQPQSVHQ